MTASLTTSEILRRARTEIDTARAAAAEDTKAANKSAQTRRIRAALGRAIRLLRPVVSRTSRRGRAATEDEKREARSLMAECDRVWR